MAIVNNKYNMNLGNKLLKGTCLNTEFVQECSSIQANASLYLHPHLMPKIEFNLLVN